MSKVQPATNSSCLGIQYQIVPNSSAKNPHDVAIAARSIIDRAAMYLKWPSRNDSSFDVLWPEISKAPIGQPKKKFALYLDKLHGLAKAAFNIDDGYSLYGVGDATAESQTTSGASTPATDYSQPSHK